MFVIPWYHLLFLFEKISVIGMIVALFKIGMKFRSLILFFIIFICAHPSSVLGEDTFLKEQIAQKIAEREKLREKLSQKEKESLDMDLFRAVDDNNYDNNTYNITKDLLAQGADPNFTLWFQAPMIVSPWVHRIGKNEKDDTLFQFQIWDFSFRYSYGYWNDYDIDKSQNLQNIICMSREELPPLKPDQKRTMISVLQASLTKQYNFELFFLLLLYGADPNADQEIEIYPKEPLYITIRNQKLPITIRNYLNPTVEHLLWWPPRRYEYLRFHIKGTLLYHFFLYHKAKFGFLNMNLDENSTQILALLISFGVDDECQATLEEKTIEKHSLLLTLQEYIESHEATLKRLDGDFTTKLRSSLPRWLNKFASSFFKYHPFANGHFNHAKFAQDVGKAIGPEFVEEVVDDCKKITRLIELHWEQLQRWKTLHYFLMKRDAKSK